MKNIVNFVWYCLFVVNVAFNDISVICTRANIFTVIPRNLISLVFYYVYWDTEDIQGVSENMQQLITSTKILF